MSYSNEAKFRHDEFWQRRQEDLFRFRLNRVKRSDLAKVVLADLSAGAPISEYSELVGEAAKQNNLDFLKKFVRAAKKKAPAGLVRVHQKDQMILYYWDVVDFGNEMGLIPGLKCFTDKAAAALIADRTGEKSFGAVAYKRRRLRLNLHPEKPAVVLSIEFLQQPGSRYVTVKLESATDRSFGEDSLS